MNIGELIQMDGYEIAWISWETSEYYFVTRIKKINSTDVTLNKVEGCWITKDELKVVSFDNNTIINTTKTNTHINSANLKRKLNRLIEQRNTMEKEQVGNELKFTYWGGYNLGYVKGKISEIEDLLDVI